MKTTRIETKTFRVEITLDNGNTPHIAYTDLRPAGYLLETPAGPACLTSMPQVLAAIEDAIDGTQPNGDSTPAQPTSGRPAPLLDDAILNARDALNALLAHPGLSFWLEKHLEWTRREVADQREGLRSTRDDLDSIVNAGD